MVYCRQRNARRVGARNDPSRRLKASWVKQLKREPPRFRPGRARRLQAVSYSSRRLSLQHYLGLVILTKPIIAQTAPNTTNRLKNAPIPRAIVRSAEF